MSCIGINPSSVNDYYGDLSFADAVKHSRGFNTPNRWFDSTSPVPNDAAGWPMADFGLMLATLPVGSAYAPLVDGTYAVRFNGQATITGIGAMSFATVRNQVYDAASNTTTALVDCAASQAYMSVSLQFTNTKRHPTDTAGTGLTNVQVMRPIAANSPTPHSFNETFSRQFLAALAPFGAIRALDLNKTNDTPQAKSATWATRRLPADPIQSDYKEGQGIAYEYQVALANALGVDLWIPLSVVADDDHVTKFFQLCLYGSDGVNPYTSAQANPVFAPLAGKLLFTYGNENWNYLFGYTHVNYNLAQTEFAAGGTDYNYDSIGNTYYYAQRRAAKQTVRLRDLAAGVFGESAFGTRFCPILESQQGGQDATVFSFLKDAMDYIVHRESRPLPRLFWGAGVSWYHSPPALQSASDAFDQADAQAQANGTPRPTWTYPTPDQTFAVPPPDHFPAIEACFDLVHNRYGLNLACYEGGEVFEKDLHSNFASEAAVQDDPRFAPYVEGTITRCVAAGASYLMVYGLGQTPWQLLRSANDLNTVKYAATVAAIHSNQGAPMPTGYPPFADINVPVKANSISANNAIYTTPVLAFASDTLIEASFQGTQPASGPGLALTVDGATVATGALPLANFPIPLTGDVGGGRVRFRTVVPAGNHVLSVKAVQDVSLGYNTPLTIVAVTTQEVETAAFNLDFASATDGADLTSLGWTHLAGPTVTIDKANGRLVRSGSGETIYQFPNVSGDYTIDLTFAFDPSTNGDGQACGRMTAGSASALVTGGPTGPVFRLRTPSGFTDGKNTGAGSYEVQLRCVGNTYTLFCNGFEVIQQTDTGAGAGGLPGFQTNADIMSLKVSNITVTNLPGAPSPTPTGPTTLALTLPASSTVVGSAGTATITLSGGPASSSPIAVVLAYSGATGPASVTVPAGSLTATFSVTPTATSYTVTPTSLGLTGPGAVSGTAVANPGSNTGTGSSPGSGSSSALTPAQAAAIAQIPFLVSQVSALSTAVSALSTAVSALPGTQGIASAVLAGLPSATIGHLADKAGFALAASGLDSIAIEPGINARQALSPILAASAGVVAGAGTGVIIIKGGNASVTRITATTDNAGNRSSVTLNLPA